MVRRTFVFVSLTIFLLIRDSSSFTVEKKPPPIIAFKSTLHMSNDSPPSCDAVVASRLPLATPAERQRFLKARDGDVDAACVQLKGYLDWLYANNGNASSSYQGDTFYDCPSGKADDCKADENTTKQPEQLKTAPVSQDIPPKAMNQDKQNITDVPSIVHMSDDPIHARDKTRVCHVMPALLDPEAATNEEHAERFARSLDERLDRQSMEKVTVLVDCRAGVGWSNVPAIKFLSFAKVASKKANDYFPERLKRCVVFPVPGLCVYIWKLIRPFVDPDTAQKVVILGGAGTGATDKVPNTLYTYIDEQNVQLMEKYRYSLFSPKKNSSSSVCAEYVNYVQC